jgi:flavorubredoxin
MPGRVVFEYDPVKNIVFTEDHCDVKTEADVDEFFEEHRKYFEQIGKKFYMISNIDDLRVHAAVAAYYGATAKTAVGHYLLGFARWGSNDVSRMTVRTSSLKADLDSNIFNTREEAVAYIENLKKNQ